MVSICPLCCLGCQYQCNQLPGKTRLWNDLLCVLWDVKPYTHSPSLWPLIHDCQQNPRLEVHIAITIWHSLSSVINHTLVVDPTSQQPGFSLPCPIPSVLDQFHAKQGWCTASLHMWWLVTSDKCDWTMQMTNCASHWWNLLMVTMAQPDFTTLMMQRKSDGHSNISAYRMKSNSSSDC